MTAEEQALWDETELGLWETIASQAEQITALKDAILDIDAHATPMGEDADGCATGGYVVSVGSLHRALGKVGHTTRKCSPDALCPTCSELMALRGALRELVEAHDRWFDTGMGEGQAIAATTKAKELLGEH